MPLASPRCPSVLPAVGERSQSAAYRCQCFCRDASLPKTFGCCGVPPLPEAAA